METVLKKEIHEEENSMAAGSIIDYDNISVKDEFECHETENCIEMNQMEEVKEENLNDYNYEVEFSSLIDKENYQSEVEKYMHLENEIDIKEEFESIIELKHNSIDHSNDMENAGRTAAMSLIGDPLTEHNNSEDSINIEETVQDGQLLENKETDEENVFSQKFKVNIAVIESITKENQAAELQSLEGLSVYDQATLEAGILQQVDQALDRELETTESSETAILLESGVEETEMERKIRLGEMTPFGTTLHMSDTSAIKHTDGLNEIQKYLQKQAELQSMGKRKITKSKQETTSEKDNVKNFPIKEKENRHDLLKKKILKQDRKKKKHKKKEVLGTETEEFVPWSEKPGLVAGEAAYMYPEEASGSEYFPSESDFILSSDDNKPVKNKDKENVKKPTTFRKRKKSVHKPYKLPEDWSTDDSDWEYSDEEGNFKNNKRSKKELDDGDVDTFNRRIRFWEKKHQEQIQEYHELDEGYKLPQDMWDKLYNYQRVGVQWLWELDRQRCGGILGDEMGLGKTIQVIAFMAGLHISQLKDKDTNYHGLGPSLIICPTTVMHQWVKEFHSWYPPLRVAILHESGTFCGKQRIRLISNMVHAGGILIISYTGATQYKDEIINRQWHYVVLDEGHKIRNPDAQITLVVKQLRTSHRVILSGSPMQNNLKELWSLFDFVFPGKLGTLPVFLEQFAVPITQGGYANASQVQVRTAFKCATVLRDTIAPYLLRRMKADVKSHVNLPEKNEQVLFCRLTDEQREYYKSYVDSGEVSRILDGRLKVFMGLITLRKICNHPDLYSGGAKLFEGESEENLPIEERYGYWGKSGKMIVVETLLKLWKKQGHRVLVFTQSRQMLCIMESFVKQAGYTYLKLDGGTSIAARQPLINKFNQETSYFVMLLTTRVGGLGVNLTGANRVLIYDPDWNPATDTQARERAWRIGQTQSVTVYRLITAGTIEEKMYHRQIFKQFLCNKVLKDPRQRRFFKANDLFELFTLKETDIEGSTETGAIFAGTDSEVKLDRTKTYKQRKIEPKLDAKPPTEIFSQKRAENNRKLEDKLKEKSKQNSPPVEKEVFFSNEKIERMKKLAQLLSQKCVKNFAQDKNSPLLKTPDKIKSTTGRKSIDIVSDEEKAFTSNTRLELELSLPSTSSTVKTPDPSLKTRKHKRKHKDKKKKHHKDAKFEGETVPHLVKMGVSAPTTVEKNTNDEDNYATQDEYVLQKLFAKSGLQTAMKHDTIMEGGPADYALVEDEAERVAKQAVDKLKQSRQECWRPNSGVPNFTGINGARNIQPKPRFGNTKTSIGNMSSSDLIEIIRKRNGIVDSKDSDLALLEDIRQFVSSHGGTVKTNQLIAKFEGRLAEGSSPLFKSLLSKICTFYRAPDKLGYWTLKSDFR